MAEAGATGEVRAPAIHPRFIFVPSDDEDFTAQVSALIATWQEGSPEEWNPQELQRMLRLHFPNATVRPRHELARLLPEDVPTWYVSRGRTRFRLHASVEIDAPREVVFRLYVDPWRMHEWLAGASLPITASATVVGNAWVAEFEILRSRLSGTFRIVEVEAPARVRVEARGPLRAQLWYVTSFLERDGATLLEVVGDYELPFRWLTGAPVRLLAEREIERTVARSHERFKALCEAAHRAAQMDLADGAVSRRSRTRSSRASRS